MSSIDWKPIEPFIEAARVCVITSHMRADCDALGSELTLAAVLESLGKEVRIVNGDAVPEHLAFVDPDGKVGVLGETVQPEELQGADTFFVVDTSAWGQLGPMADVLRGFTGAKLLIDHHVSSDDLGVQVFKDSSAEATGRLILELAEHLGVELSSQTAQLCFTAIATDTGWFRFSSVTGDTFRALAKLADAGASPPEVFSALYEKHSLPRLHLRGRILSNIEPHAGGRLHTSAVSQKDFEETDSATTDTEDAINALLSIDGSQVAALFVELPDGQTKVSLRSRGGLDVSAVAEQFGGGGHRAASGIRVDKPLAEAQQMILDALLKALG